ncbi:uncharacterized protein LOC129939434 [Eupeodes corollae]|uniref:uncharacterized protein LOC129939434 n=1 Tax=Eupeodes corollae TaxID=290404 RepID=UPI002492C775|nr:uncharacterized protein LOC129939434 [Eupeodes corollae]
MVAKTLNPKKAGKQNPKKKQTLEKAPKAVSPASESASENETETKMEVEVEQNSDVRDVGVEQTLLITNLPGKANRSHIINLFAPYGKIQLVLFTKTNNEGKASAYVVLDSAEGAKKALELNGKKIQTDEIIVQKPYDVKANIDPTRKVKNFVLQTPTNTVFVQNMKKTTFNLTLKNFFSSCGEVEYVRILKDHKTQLSKGKGFVCFKDPASISAALKLSGKKLDDQEISVEPFEERPKKTFKSFNKDSNSKKPQKKVASQ